MTSRRTAPPETAGGSHRKTEAGARAGDAAPGAAAPTPSAPALKPRKTLFIVLMIVLVIWVGFLVTIYLMTVRAPRVRHHQQPTPQPIPQPATSQSDIRSPRAA